jgi:hypothetical protein
MLSILGERMAAAVTRDGHLLVALHIQDLVQSVSLQRVVEETTRSPEPHGRGAKVDATLENPRGHAGLEFARLAQNAWRGRIAHGCIPSSWAGLVPNGTKDDVTASRACRTVTNSLLLDGART